MQLLNRGHTIADTLITHILATVNTIADTLIILR